MQLTLNSTFKKAQLLSAFTWTLNFNGLCIHTNKKKQVIGIAISSYLCIMQMFTMVICAFKNNVHRSCIKPKIIWYPAEVVYKCVYHSFDCMWSRWKPLYAYTYQSCLNLITMTIQIFSNFIYQCALTDLICTFSITTVYRPFTVTYAS